MAPRKTTAPASQQGAPQGADPDQSRRFIEMARELGCDETGEAFERGFALVAAAAGKADETASEKSRDAVPRPAGRKQPSRNRRDR